MLTKKQRREINRKNAARSTGPITLDGKNRSRLNALKHGLRAETIVLPHEDPNLLQDCFDDWTDHYGPDSPGERVLARRAAYCEIQLGRCAIHQAAHAARQIRHALLDFDDRQRTEVEALKRALMGDDPRDAVGRLRQSAAGCHWLIFALGSTAQILRDGAFWDAGDRDFAIRLTGSHPSHSGIEHSVLKMALLERRSLYHPAVFETEENAAEWAAFRAQLLGYLDEEIATLGAREERLRREIEAPDRAEAVSRALLVEGPNAALYQRYERMYELGFHRVYQAILKAIAVAEKAEKDGEFDEEGEPELARGSKAPNEANGGTKEELRSSKARTSGSGSGANRTEVSVGEALDSMVSGDADCSARVAGVPGGLSAG